MLRAPLLLRIIAEIVLIIAVMETAVLYLMPVLAPWWSGWKEAALDSVLLSLLTAPLIAWRVEQWAQGQTLEPIAKRSTGYWAVALLTGGMILLGLGATAWSAHMLRHAAEHRTLRLIEHRVNAPAITIVLGSMLSLLLGAVVWSLAWARVRAQQMAMAMNRDLLRAQDETRRAMRDASALRSAIDEHAIVAVTDPAGTILEVNDAFCRISKYSREELIGQNHRIINSGLHPKAFFTEMYRTISRGDAWHGEIRNRAKDGRFYWVDTTIVPFKDASGKIEKHVAIRADITDRKLAEEELRRSALLDRLTGLPNRTLLLERLNQCIARASRSPGRSFAVLFLDFDRFKLINDSLGHEAGDTLLREIAARLRSALRATDTLAREVEGVTAARLGGDEFVVILDEIAKPADACVVAGRLLEVFAKPYRLGGSEIVSTASIGIVTSELARGVAEDVLRDADTAMYEAKLAGKGRFVVFDEGMRDRVKRRMTLENELRRALDEQQLTVVYQPIVALENGRCTGMEALVRWDHPQRGPVPPVEFIPVAEETGLIIPIGEWVLTQACEALATWQDRYPKITARMTIAVNLSRAQLAMDDLPARLGNVLARTALNPRALRLEVTENQVVGRADMRGMLTRLKLMGLTLAMDDFGTGLSSLSGLHQLPFDVVKIDRSFVSSITRGKHFMALVQSIVNLANNLGMKSVAEGIETHEQVVAMQSLGCEYGQGYFFSKPLTRGEMELRLAQEGQFLVAA